MGKVKVKHTHKKKTSRASAGHLSKEREKVLQWLKKHPEFVKEWEEYLEMLREE